MKFRDLPCVDECERHSAQNSLVSSFVTAVRTAVSAQRDFAVDWQVQVRATVLIPGNTSFVPVDWTAFEQCDRQSRFPYGDSARWTHIQILLPIPGLTPNLSDPALVEVVETVELEVIHSYWMAIGNLVILRGWFLFTRLRSRNATLTHEFLGIRFPTIEANCLECT